MIRFGEVGEVFRGVGELGALSSLFSLSLCSDSSDTCFPKQERKPPSTKTKTKIDNGMVEIYGYRYCWIQIK